MILFLVNKSIIKQTIPEYPLSILTYFSAPHISVLQEKQRGWRTVAHRCHYLDGTQYYKSGVAYLLKVQNVERKGLARVGHPL